MGRRPAIVEEFVCQVGAHDSLDTFAGPAGDLGLVGGPDSVSWRIHADPAALALGGIGAIITEMLHPSVMAGVEQFSSYRTDPFRRARTTYGYVVTTTFGSTTAAEGLIERVRRMHGRVQGRRPDGVEFRALDPELIAWVHTAIPWAVMRAYERVNRPLSAVDKDRYLAEQSVIGLMGGAEQVPTTVAELYAFVDHMRPRLAVTEQTRAFFDFLQGSPFGVRVPGPLGPIANRFQIEAGMSVMPRWLRHLSGFEHSVLAQRLVYDAPIRSYAARLRRGFGTPPYVAMAQRRVATVAPAVAVPA